MTLAALIRKRATGKPATAIPAISATQGRIAGSTVARIATVAVANPTESKSAKPCGAQGTGGAFRWWLIHYCDREPLVVSCCPEATNAEILERHPDAAAAQPFEPARREPNALMTADEEEAIRAWLAMIDESDPETIANLLTECQLDSEAREYFLQRSREAEQ
jgi:hypothetical protein